MVRVVSIFLAVAALLSTLAYVFDPMELFGTALRSVAQPQGEKPSPPQSFMQKQQEAAAPHAAVNASENEGTCPYGCGGPTCGGSCWNAGARPGKLCQAGKSTGYFCALEHGRDGPYACMDWTLGSKAMQAAEEKYNARSGHARKVYFGVGTYGTAADPLRGLGQCVLMDVDGADRLILAQSINTGSDVSGNQFDLQIGAGGAGAFNDCAGSDSVSMFPGSKDVWGAVYGGFPTRAECKGLPKYPVQSGPMKASGDDLQTLCEIGFDRGVRGADGSNPTIGWFYRVNCPDELTHMTQLKRSDDPPEEMMFNHTEFMSRRLEAPHKCGGGSWGENAWCLTRMMDCRKPSGGFKDNLNKKLTKPGKRLVQPCSADGYTRLDNQCGCHGCYC